MGPLIGPCVATTTNRHTYQICARHLGIREALWADQNMVLLFIHAHLPQKHQSQSSASIIARELKHRKWNSLLEKHLYQEGKNKQEKHIFYNYLESRQAIL